MSLDTFPLSVIRNGDEIVIPCNEVEYGDRVFLGGVQYIVDHGWKDENDEVFYIAIKETVFRSISVINSYPAAMFDRL